MTIFVAGMLVVLLGPLAARFGVDSRDGRDWNVAMQPPAPSPYGGGVGR
jgi:hypothetical protein